MITERGSNAPYVAGPKLRIGVLGLRGFPATYSGIETAAEHLYPALASRGHLVTVYGRPAYTPTVDYIHRGVRVVRVGALSPPTVETLSHVGYSVGRSIFLGLPDVIHMHALASALMLSFYKILKVPTVLTVHGLDWQRARWKGCGSLVLLTAERAAVRFADEIIVVSSELQRYYWKRYRRPTHLIHNPAAAPAPLAEQGRRTLRSLGVNAERYILFVGRFVPEKRVEDLLVAFRGMQVREQLVLVGAGRPNYVAHLRELARGDERVRFVGQCTHNEVLSALSLASACVMPSDLEGFPMSVLESAAHGVPTVVSDIPPHREIFSGVPGYDLFFRVGDISELRAKLSYVLAHRRRSRELAERAQAAVTSTLTPARFVEMTEAVLFLAAQRRRSVSE